LDRFSDWNRAEAIRRGDTDRALHAGRCAANLPQESLQIVFPKQ
jgi:hypothetical protein